MCVCARASVILFFKYSVPSLLFTYNFLVNFMVLPAFSYCFYLHIHTIFSLLFSGPSCQFIDGLVGLDNQFMRMTYDNIYVGWLVGWLDGWLVGTHWNCVELVDCPA